MDLPWPKSETTSTESGDEGADIDIDIDMEEFRESDRANSGDSNTKALKVLLNEVILDKIAKHLPAKTLLTLRLTCKTWSSVFTHALKKCGDHDNHEPIELRHNESDTLLHRQLHAPQESKVTSFTELMRSSANNPYTSYKLNCPTLKAYATPIEKFFSIFGYSIRVLELQLRGDITHENLKLMRKALSGTEAWTPQLEELKITFAAWLAAPTLLELEPESVIGRIPSLRRLQFHGDFDNTNEVPAAATTFPVDLVRAATQLQTLIMSFDGLNQSPLRNVAKVTSFLSLKALHIQKPSTTLLNILVEIGSNTEAPPLRLEEFKASLIFSRWHEYDDGDRDAGVYLTEAPRLLHTFLVTQAPTLKSLQLQIKLEAMGETVLRVPPMLIDDLSMDVTGTGRRLHDRVILKLGRGTLMDNFPRLKRLAYNHHGENLRFYNTVDAADPSNLQLLAHEGVTQLELCLYGQDQDGAESSPLFQLLTLFPFVTRLDATLHSNRMEGMTKVWNLWPTLRTLNIVLSTQIRVEEPDRKMDELLSGILSNRHEDLARDISSLTSSSSADISDPQGQKQQPILQLDNVRQLFDKYKARPLVSDLRHLQELKLRVKYISYTRRHDKFVSIVTDIGMLALAMAGPTLQKLHLDTRREPGRRSCDIGIRSSGVFVSEECSKFLRSALGPVADIEIL